MTHRVHLDYASYAPIRPPVQAAMISAIESGHSDARRLYDDAIRVRYEIESSRESVAHLISCDPFEVIFTSSHSESLATFAYGVIPRTSPEALLSPTTPPLVVTTPYDSQVLVDSWLRENVSVSVLAGNESATLNLDGIETLSSPLAFSLPFAHPDTGTLQDIPTIVRRIRESFPQCMIHLDARMALGYHTLSLSDLGVDAMSIDPSVCGGPMGVASLVLSRHHHLHPLLTGATQERARRAGIENYVGIMGFGKLCEELAITQENEIAFSADIKREVYSSLRSAGAIVIDDDKESSHTLCNIVAAYFPGVAASAVVSEMNRMGINIHAGSSCGSEEFEPSSQLAPVTGDDSISESVFRISWGYGTEQSCISALSSALSDLTFS